ncbi:hypothetical protein BH09VER1_BH09VER1_24450 [soil metagenome]
MKRIALILISSALLALGASSSALAQSIWTNPITGTDPGLTNPYTTGQTVDSNITVSGIGHGSGVAGNSASNRYNENGWNSSALDSNDYFSFTLDANTGFEIDFVSFVYTGQASGTGPTQFSLRSSLDNYAAAIGSASKAGTTISLSDAAYQNLTSPITFRLYAWGASSSAGTYSINDFTFNGVVSAAAPTNNDSVITVAANAATFNRVMQGSSTSQNITLNKSGASAAPFSATISGNATTSTPTGNITGLSSTVNVGIDTTTTGAKTGTVTVDNTATTSNAAGQGSLDPNDVINVSGTVVDNRTVSATSVDLGKVFTDAVVTGTTTLTTTGADDQFTRITTSGAAVSTGGVTVGASSSTTFNSASVTVDRSVTGSFSTSGAKNVTANIGVTGEGLAGENAQASVGVTATADVYERALLSTNNGSSFDDGATVTVDNAIADGAQRASAQVASKSVTSGWTVSGLDAGTDIAENGEASGSVTFSDTGKLNGTHLGTLVLGFQYSDSSIQGAGTSPSELAARTWNFSRTVSGNVANSGSAGVDAGKSFAGLGLVSATSAGTQATLLSGTASVSTNVTIDFSTIDPGASNDLKRASDVVSLAGTSTDTVVLQLTYNEADLGALSEDDLRLGWLSGGQWVLAIDGNTGGTPAFFLGAYAGQGLGSFGLDATNNTVWAVIDHNSDFAVIAVPEPGTYALLVLGGIVLVIFRRRQSTTSV